MRAYQQATKAIEGAGADPDALEKAMDRFEKATATMDRVGGWDVETYAQQVRVVLDGPGSVVLGCVCFSFVV